jgi:hypothetical protein
MICYFNYNNKEIYDQFYEKLCEHVRENGKAIGNITCREFITYNMCIDAVANNKDAMKNIPKKYYYQIKESVYRLLYE